MSRLRYVVTGVDTTDRVGGEFGTDADRQFVVVRLEVTNRGSTPTRLTGDGVTLVDADGGTYETDGSAMVLVAGSLDLRTLGPGATVEGVVVFDAPPDGQGRRLRIDPVNASAPGRPQYVRLD